MKDTEKGARTIVEIEKLSKQCQTKTNETYGCIKQPLFPCIPVHYIIPDTLNLFLRISDVLIDLLIRDVREEDAKKKSSTNFHKYISFLNEKCKISFHVYKGKEDKD